MGFLVLFFVGLVWFCFGVLFGFFLWVREQVLPVVP